MKIAAVLARHRRLLALCAASLLLHILAIEWIAARHGAAEDARPAPAEAPLALRLARPGPALAEPAAAPAPAPQLKQAAAPSPPAPKAAQPAAASVPAAEPGSGSGDTALGQMPGRYRVRMPPSVHLAYALTRALPGQAAAPPESAQLDWQAGGGRYTLSVDGVTGRLASQGGGGDAGIAPGEASEQRADGSVATTRFDDDAGRIAFSAAPRSYPLHPGSQDRASLLMQLAGIGLAEPDQMQGVIEVFVGGAQDAGVARFQVMGREALATGLGTLDCVHLAQLAAPGETRLEVWLAPERSWYPVQLRTTAPDGAVATQVATALTRPQ